MCRKKTLYFFIIMLYAYMSLPMYAYAAPEPGDKKEVEIIWSRTTEPDGAKKLPVASWNWSDVQNINHSMTSNVWDGGTIGDFYIKDARREWDIATWHTNRSYWNGTCDVRRFHGEFSIPDGYSLNDDVMISSVGNYDALGLKNIIAINDNIYIFIYPKGQDINNGNFLEHLAFWTGTACQEAAKAVNNGNPITFHGIEGTTPWDYKEIIGPPIPKENLLSHTDGWYCEASQNNIGYIMKNYPDATEFVIDLIVEDYAEDGGMDRLGLTFTKTAKEIIDGEIPDTELPDTELPDTELPDTEIPDTELPDIENPKQIENPNKGTPDPEIPKEEIPEEELPQGEINETGSPEEEASDEEIPNTEIPRSKIPESRISRTPLINNEGNPQTGVRSVLPYVITIIIAGAGVYYWFKKRKK